MRIVDGERWYTIREVGEIIHRGSKTIKNWYLWAELIDKFTLELFPPLPTPRTDFNKIGTRFFTESDIQRLILFRDSINYGSMSDFSNGTLQREAKEAKEAKEAAKRAESSS